jgi:hypothetical protein
MYNTLDFFPRPARKETNVPKYKKRQELTVLIYTVAKKLHDLYEKNWKKRSSSSTIYEDKMEHFLLPSGLVKNHCTLLQFSTIFTLNG